MKVVIQRSTEPVPYRGAFFRVAGEEARAGLTLAPGAGGDTLALLLALTLVFGNAGGPAIRQYWVGEDGEVEGKMATELAPRHAGEVRRVAERVRAEWDRFIASALARLDGEERGSAHFAWPPGGWSADRPAVAVTRWPPLEGEVLPVVE